jgi:hypothetical protein
MAKKIVTVSQKVEENRKAQVEMVGRCREWTMIAEREDIEAKDNQRTP